MRTACSSLRRANSESEDVDMPIAAQFLQSQAIGCHWAWPMLQGACWVLASIDVDRCPEQAQEMGGVFLQH